MISTLRLQNFRCFDVAAWEFPLEGAILLGDNARGKTSVLEAVCVLTRLQSPRARTMGRLLKVESPEFGIAGDCWGEDRQVRYRPHCGVAMQVEGEAVAKQADYLRSGGLVVWMGNDDLDLVRGSGQSRRRYLDFLGSQIDPLYRSHLHRYQRVLKARNLLLKQFPQGNNETEIVAYSKLLIEHGNYLTMSRKKMLECLEPESSAAQLAVSGKGERIGLEYLPGSGDDLAQSLETTHERERRLGQTVAGPHRDEVRLTINGMAAADFASEGQQRTLALALKLAQGVLLEKQARKTPVYLLDDIFGELDSARRNALMDVLPAAAQKIITTTNIDWLDGEFVVIKM